MPRKTRTTTTQPKAPVSYGFLYLALMHWPRDILDLIVSLAVPSCRETRLMLSQASCKVHTSRVLKLVANPTCRVKAMPEPTRRVRKDQRVRPNSAPVLGWWG